MTSSNDKRKPLRLPNKPWRKTIMMVCRERRYLRRLVPCRVDCRGQDERQVWRVVMDIEQLVNVILVAALAELAARGGSAWREQRRTSFALLATLDLDPTCRRLHARLQVGARTDVSPHHNSRAPG